MDREWEVGDVVLVKEERDVYHCRHHIIRKTQKRGVLDDGRQFWLESGRLFKQFELKVVLATDDLLAIYEEQEQKRAEEKRRNEHRSLLRKKAYKGVIYCHLRSSYFQYCSDEQLEKVVAVFEEVFPHLYSQEEGRE